MNGVSSFASPRNVKPYYSSRSPLPILPPMEHYKGRRLPDIDLLTPGLKTRYYNEFSHSIEWSGEEGELTGEDEVIMIAFLLLSLASKYSIRE